MTPELEPEDAQRLQTALIAIFEIVEAKAGMHEEYFRKLLAESGLKVVSTQARVVN